MKKVMFTNNIDRKSLTTLEQKIYAYVVKHDFVKGYRIDGNAVLLERKDGKVERLSVDRIKGDFSYR